MNDDEKFDVVIGEPKEKVELGKNFIASFRLTLLDKNGKKINQTSLVNEDTKAELEVFLVKNSDEFPDKVSEFTYRLGEIKNFEHENGKYVITATPEEEKKIKDRINNVNGKLIENSFSSQLGGNGFLLEPDSDIKFKLVSDQSAGRGIRVDIYRCPSNSSISAEQKPIQMIAGERVQIDLI